VKHKPRKVFNPPHLLNQQHPHQGLQSNLAHLLLIIIIPAKDFPKVLPPLHSKRMLATAVTLLLHRIKIRISLITHMATAAVEVDTGLEALPIKMAQLI